MYPALVAGRREAGDVANDPTAKGDQCGRAVEALFQERIEDPVDRLQGLELFTVGKHQRFALEAAQRIQHTVQIQGGNRLVGHHEYLLAWNVAQEEIRLCQQA